MAVLSVFVLSNVNFIPQIEGHMAFSRVDILEMVDVNYISTLNKKSLNGHGAAQTISPPIEEIAQHIWLSYTNCKMPPLVGNNNMK